MMNFHAPSAGNSNFSYQIAYPVSKRWRDFRRLILSFAPLPLLTITASGAVPVIEDPGPVDPTVVELISDTDVAIQIFASDNPTSYSASGLPSGLSIDSDSGLISGNVNNATSAAVTLNATNAEGTGMYSATFEVFDREPTLPPPNTTTTKKLENGMDVDTVEMAPFAQSPSNEPNTYFYNLTNSPTHVGNDLIRNRFNLPDRSETGVRTYVQGPAEVTFNWEVDIESGFDFLSFYVNQDPVPSPNPGAQFHIAGHGDVFITGDTTPADYTTVLGPGLHRLEWIYSKDYNDAAGGDSRCLIDNLRIVGLPEWAENENLTVFESDYRIDKEQDGNPLIMEYALGLNPNQKELVLPLLTFAPDGRAMLEIDRDDSLFGVTVDIEKSTLLTPASWAASLLDDGSSSNVLKRIEATPQTDAYYRVNVTSP